MELFGKVDGALLAIIGGIGWVLQANDHDAAVVLGIVAAVAGVVGSVVAIVVWLVGGHQTPQLTASFGHLAPWLTRAAILIGLAWVGAWAATEAGVESEGLAVAISIAVFGGIGDLLKPLKEATDALRPAAFGKSSIEHVYGDRFNVSPGETSIGLINARAAVHENPALVHNKDGRHTETVTGWKRGARQQRLELIAAGVRPRQQQRA
jgi:hypothetical protein